MQRNKLFKKLTAVVCSCALIATSMCSVFAADVNSTEAFVGNEMTISFNMDTVGYGTMVYVFEGKLDTSADITTSDLETKLKYATIVDNEDAEKSVKVTFPSTAAYGVYTVVYGSEAIEHDDEDRFFYALRVDESAVSTAISTLSTSADAATLYTDLDTYNDQMYIADVASLADDQTLLYDIAAATDYQTNVGLATDKTELRTLSEALLTAANDASVLKTGAASVEEFQKIVEDNKAILDDTGKLTTPDAGETESDFEANAAEAYRVYATVAANAGTVNTLGNIQDVLYEATAVAAFNNAIDDSAYDVINKYNDVFGIDTSAYAGFSEESTYQLQKYLANIKAESASSIKTQVANAVTSVLSAGSGSSGGGGGAGGGGGGSSSGGGSDSVGYSAPIVVKPADIEEMTGDTETTFTDIEGYDWAAPAIEYLFDNEVITGDGDGKFRPEDPITREEFVKILVLAFGFNNQELASVFEDVAEDAWYKPYVMTAKANRIVNGVDAKHYGVGQYITRQDASVMVSNAVDAAFITMVKKKTLVYFTDYGQVADYAVTAVDKLARWEVINGFEDGSFQPTGNITRAQAAKIIYECAKNK